MKHSIRLCLFMLVGVCPALYGQSGFGSITGRLLDSSGGVIPGATVVATNTGTSTRIEGRSNSTGEYSLLELAPGNYLLEASADGFKKLSRTGVTIQVADRLTIDLPLQVGSATDTVSVSAEASQLRTEDAQIGEVINNNFIENLPQLDRNPLNLLKLSGNVQGSGGVNGDTRINGGRTTSVEYLQDGVILGSGRGHLVSSMRPDMDAVQEFKVLTNGISAEFGRISGGLVEIVTQSGSNQIHGQLYEYIQNDAFNANSWLQNSLGGAKTPFRQNDFGFTIGGPIVIPKVYNGRNKTFFFADYEGYRFKQSGSLQTANVPTAAERTGDFSGTYANGIPTMMYDPNGPAVPQLDASGNPTGTYQRTGLLGGDGKHVPASLISPISAAFLKTVPLPNIRGNPASSSQANYVAPQSTDNENDRWSLRLDQSITANQRIFGRFSTLSLDNGSTRWFSPLSTASSTNQHGGRLFTLNYDWTISPTLLFNIRGGVNHDPIATGSQLPGDFTNTSLGLPTAITSILGNANIPTIQTDFMGGFNPGATNSVNQSISTTYNVGFTVTKVLGRHTIKSGYEGRRYYDNYYTSGNGIITFDGNPLAQLSGDHGYGESHSQANSLGAFLLGIDDRLNVTGPTTRAMNVNYNALFVQDDVKVNSRWTVNLGLRWDREGQTTERHDKLYLWDQDAPPNFKVNAGYNFQAALAAAGLPTNLPAPSWVTNGFPNGAVRIANTPEYPSRGGGQPSNLQFAPRVGTAYQINPKTVVRGSFGIMYLSTTGDPNGFSSSNASLPLSDAASAGWHASNDNGLHYISTWTNPFPYAGDVVSYQRNNQLANVQSAQDPGPVVFNSKMHQPYEMTWSGGVQRQLPNNFLLEVNYSANRGLKLLAPELISRFPKNLFIPSNQKVFTTSVASPTAGQTLETQQVGTNQLLAYLYYPYPYYGAVTVLGSNAGASTYNSMNVRLERRFAQGLSFLFNYTLSKNLDDVGGPEADTGGGINAGGTGSKPVQSVDTFSSSWGLSALDQTHRISTAYSYQFPVGRGKQFLGSPHGLKSTLLDYAIGGWELAGYTSYHSGSPLTFSNDTQNTNNNIKVETTFGSYTSSDHNIGNAAFSSNTQVLYGPLQGVTSASVGRFDKTKVSDAQVFTYGNLPSVYGGIRNPANTQTDASLMKRFAISKEGRVFLQFRAEAQNVFNIRGFGTYNTKIGDPGFGLITSAGNTERHMQLSARIVF